MTDQEWRPLGVDNEDNIAEYDALHDGVPSWMSTVFWRWIQMGITISGPDDDSIYNRRAAYLDEDLAEHMCQRLKISLPNIKRSARTALDGEIQLGAAMRALVKHPLPLQIADYLLAHDGHAPAEELDQLLERSKSRYAVGERNGKPGLVERVPLGVQVAADDVMARAGRAGVRLADAWENLYGLEPDPSAAYSQAIKAVEDAAVPVVSSTNNSATLGTVIKQMTDQKNWRLPMDREHSNAPSGDVLIGMMRMLWHGQHDRHGGQPSAPGNVSQEEAAVAVGLAVTLVSWFDSALPARRAALVEGTDTEV